MKKVKNVLILGDSYSTFRGCNPDGFAVYYSPDETEKTDVRARSETWWARLEERAELNILENNSWSGSTVGYTGYNGSDCSHTSSFIYRLGKLAERGFFENEKPDTVLIFGGTNDSWANVPLGNVTFTDHSDEARRTVLPAICCITRMLSELLPKGRVIFIINTNIKPEIGEAIKLAAEHYGTEYIELKDIDKRNGHPTVKGMEDIANEVYAYITEA